jgi:hypothetical protein
MLMTIAVGVAAMPKAKMPDGSYPPGIWLSLPEA